MREVQTKKLTTSVQKKITLKNAINWEHFKKSICFSKRHFATFLKVECNICRSEMLDKEYSFANTGLDTAETEPSEVS